MKFDNPVLLALIGLIGCGVIGVVIAHFFSREARLSRKRRRNNYRVVSKARRPMVTLRVWE